MARERISIPIQGINRSESDATVRDGSCEDLYNLRYRSGVFESVCRPQIIHSIGNANGFTVVYRLEPMPSDEYLAEKDGALWHIRISEGQIIGIGQLMLFPSGSTAIRYARFGNVLYVNYVNSDQPQEETYQYKSGGFRRFDMNAIGYPDIRITCESKKIPGTIINFGSSSYDVGVKYAYVESHTDSTKDVVEYYDNVHVESLNKEGYTTGGCYVFAAYRLFDGSVIKPGPIHFLSAGGDSKYLFKHITEFRGEGANGTVLKCDFYGPLSGFKATVEVKIPQEVLDNEMIESVMLFSSRNMPLHDLIGIYEKFGSTEFPSEVVAGGGRDVIGIYRCGIGCVANDELDESLGPMYELEEIKFRQGIYSVELTYSEHFQHIESQLLYEANYSPHSTVSRHKYDYNDRLHIFDLYTSLFGGFDLLDRKSHAETQLSVYHPNTVTFVIDVVLNVESEQYRIRKKIDGGYWTLTDNRTAEPMDCIQTNSVICYPDARAVKIEVWGMMNEQVVFAQTYSLQQSSANNFSTFRAKQQVFPLTTYSVSIPSDVPSYVVIDTKNKLQVSHPSNPFVYAPANIYTIGSQGETIREVISTAERMTEAAYGYQPLLVFTDRAVYALESGEGEVLYARNIPILSRAIYEGTNAVEGNGSVFFSCSSGVISIVRGKITNISEVMRRVAGSVPPSGSNEPVFENYLQGARLLFNRKESELIVYNPDYTYAYLYSLSGNYWSRRRWESAIEPYFDEVVLSEGIASLSEEDISKPETDCSLITRPMKFGSTDYTRLDTVAARMRWGDKRRFVLQAEGSDDCVRWVVLHSEPDLPYLRRMPSSFRYHRIRLVGSVGDYLAVTHFDVEYYTKFVHRLR